MGWTGPLIRRGGCLACDTEKESPHFWEYFCIKPWKAGKMFGGSIKEYEAFCSWTAAGRPEPSLHSDPAIEMGRAAGRAFAEVMDKAIMDIPPAPQPRRWLVWRGKRYEEAACVECGKLRAVTEIIGKDLEGEWSSGKMCYKCHYREIELSERVASELRSACAGGTWTEPEAKP